MRNIILTDKRGARLQHVIPSFYLKKFQGEGELFAYERDKPPRRIAVDRDKSIKECRERDFYEYEVNGEKTNYRLERFLEKIEGWAGEVYPTIEEARVPTEEEVAKWAIFVSSLFLRSRKVRSQLVGPGMRRTQSSLLTTEHLREAQHNFLKTGRLISYEALRSRMERLWSEMQDPAFGHAIAMERSTHTLAEALASKQWHTLDCSDESFFITSDAPVITMKMIGGGRADLGHGFSQPDVAVLLPISSRQIFIASPSTTGWLKIQDANNVELLNHAVARFADRTVYAPTRSLQIQEMVDKEAGFIQFGRNAFVSRA